VSTSVQIQQAKSLFHQPFLDLIFEAQKIHREHFNPNEIQMSTLLSLKTGGCTEDCAYCAQSKRNQKPIEKKPLMCLEDVLSAARRAKEAGCNRLCMGCAGRGPSHTDLEPICEMIAEVKKLGLETCVTLGLLTCDQAKRLKESGLDYYNHNIDTSPEYYSQIITTRTFEDRIKTIENLRECGIKVCCGGILGMGESNDDRISMAVALATLNPHPESVPINWLVPVPGTPMENAPKMNPFDFVRTVALARILMPTSRIRLAAGREAMSDELHALCFAAGANTIYQGNKLLTVNNAAPERDQKLLATLGLLLR
jgi:biotin synthase